MKKLILFSFAITLFLTGSVFAQWVQTSTVPTAQVRSISINGSNILVGSMTGWAFGPAGGVYYSTNGGTTFTKTAVTPNTRVWSVFLAGTSFLVGSDGGGIHLSTNNGASWTNPLPGASIRAFASDGAGNLFAAGYPSGVWRSTNNGASWAVLSTPSGNLLSITTVGSNIFVGANAGGIYRSSNGGTTWTQPLTASTNVWSFATIGSTIFANSTTGLYKSTDDGLSWTLVSNPGSSWQACPMVAVGTTLLVGTSTGVKRSTDSGLTWTLVNTGLTVEVAGLAADNQFAYAGSGGYTLTGSFWRRPLSEMIPSPCINPTVSGAISGNQESCGSFDPALITSDSPASGETGTMEYKWQSSVFPFTTWTDILSNTITYDPLPITETTSYKRLARVTCKSNWTGAAESNVVTMTVNPVLAASVSIAAVPSGPVCAGTSVTYTATPVNGGTTPTYQWKLSGVDIAGETASTYSYVPTNGDAISVVMTADPTLTCVSGSPATSTEMVMTVNPLLPASVSVAAVPSGPVCAGTSVTFTATPINGGTTPTYQWKLGGIDIVGETASAYSYVPTNGDAISVVMTADPTLACVSGSPVTSTEMVMTVNPLLPSSVSVAAVPSGPVCAGTSVTFTATPVNGGTTPTYQWKLGGVDIVGETASTYSYVPTNGDAISVIMTADPTLACVSGSPTTSTEMVMTVNPLLPASVSVAAVPSGPVCIGTSVTYTATPVNGGTTSTYQWKLGDVDIVGETASTYSYVPTNGDAISVVMTADPALACVSGSPATSTEMVMTVNPFLPASVSIAADANPACDGTPVVFTAIPINGGNAPTVEWFKNTLLVGTGLTYSYTPVNGDQVYAVMTSDPTLACVIGSPATSNTVMMTVNALPTALITSNTGTNELTCTITSISLTASGGVSYLWNKGLGTNATVQVTTPGNNYQVTVTNANGCSSITSIDITQAPGISVVTASAGAIATIGGTATLTVNVTGGVQPYTYSLNGGAPQASNTFTVGAGTYTVNAKDANGCTMNSNTVIITDPVFLPSFLTYTGVLSVQTNSQANLSATLLNSSNKGISGRTILFTVGLQSVSAITNAQGKASASLGINQAVGNYTMITSFAGDATYMSSSDNDPFSITVRPISVTASLVGTVTKPYDGNKTAYMLPGNYQLNGIATGDNVSLNNPASGTYNNKNVGTNKTVTVTGLALTGPDAGKYILNSTTASANIGIITALKSAEILTAVPTVETPTLKVYPNPFTEKLNIEFSSPSDTHAKIEIFNIVGAQLEILFNREIKANELYNVEYIPHLVSSQVVIYRLTMNGMTQQGKFIYQEPR